MSVEIRRGDDRGHTRADGLDTRHSFSYGSYYDPANVGFGVLQACNEERLAAGRGYDLHRHRNVEIVTWVLAGELAHTDDTGHRSVLTAAMAQHLGAGAGLRHGEHGGGTAGAHYVQMWVRPSVPDLHPTYGAHDFTTALATGRWVPVAAGAPDSAAPLRLRQLDAELRAVRLAAGATASVPVADLVHLQITRGAVGLAGETLRAGDAVRLSDADAVSVTALERAELLAWLMYR